MKKRNSILMIIVIGLVLVFVHRSGSRVYAAIKPEIVLTEYSISDDFVFGEETIINVSFMNMSEEMACSDLLITYTSANQSIIPSFGHSNQLFIRHLEAQQEETIQIPVIIYDRGNGYAVMSFNIEYTVEEAILYNSSAYIAFQVEENETEEAVYIRNVNVTTESTIGANSLVSISFDNLLKTDLSNTKLVISGDVNDGTIIYQIGNVAPKATKYAEYYLRFDTVGQKAVKMQIIYTLDTGEEMTQDVGDYIISVKESTLHTGNDNEQTEGGQEFKEQTDGSMNLAIIFLILGGVLLLAAIAILIVSQLKKKNSD